MITRPGSVITDVITLGDSLVPLIRSESQGAPLLDHYKDSDTCSEWVVEMNAAMRSLIPALNAKLPSTTVWGLTSHNSLGLMSVPKYDAGESHVNIEHFEFGYFRLGYRPPTDCCHSQMPTYNLALQGKRKRSRNY